MRYSWFLHILGSNSNHDQGENFIICPLRLKRKLLKWKFSSKIYKYWVQPKMESANDSFGTSEVAVHICTDSFTDEKKLSIFIHPYHVLFQYYQTIFSF